MILYHGSNIRIDCPDLSKSKPYKDFGKGFYLSDKYEQAFLLAEQRTKIMQCGEPCVSKFSFDEKFMHSDELDVLVFEDYSEEWVNFVIKNRDLTTPQPYHHFDIVYGPIADDGVTFLLRRYKAGGISFKELMDGLKYPLGITFQYYFGSTKALSKLHKI